MVMSKNHDAMTKVKRNALVYLLYIIMTGTNIENTQSNIFGTWGTPQPNKVYQSFTHEHERRKGIVVHRALILVMMNGWLSYYTFSTRRNSYFRLILIYPIKYIWRFAFHEVWKQHYSTTFLVFIASVIHSFTST